MELDGGGRVGRRRHLVFSLLALLTATLAILAVASASPAAAARTRVRANAPTITTRVGLDQRVIADHVGRLRPPTTTLVSATGVATEAGMSASPIFTESGGLQPSVIQSSHEIISGSQLGNPAVIKALTSDGSNIADWGKYTTSTFNSPSGPFQVHFYYNSVTDAVDYGIDYKSVFNKGIQP